LRLGMVEQLRESHAAQFARFSVVYAGIVDHRCLRTGAGHDHRVPRGRLAELAVEEQVAGLGHAHIAADKVGIPLDQSFSVGKLGKGAVGCVSGFKAAGLDPEERGAQRSIGVAPGANLPRQRRTSMPVARNQESSWRFSASR